MIDENAFGLYLGFATLDEEEYGLPAEQFTRRLQAFHGAVEELLGEVDLGEEAHAVDLGHAVYVELADGELELDLVQWLREARAHLTGRQLESVAVLTHGGRWVLEEHEPPRAALLGQLAVFRVPGPSEALRRALAAATAAVQDDGETSGWGPGLYLDAEALEALGKRLKNTPTVLSVAGANFYRIGR